MLPVNTHHTQMYVGSRHQLHTVKPPTNDILMISHVTWSSSHVMLAPPTLQCGSSSLNSCGPMRRRSRTPFSFPLSNRACRRGISPSSTATITWGRGQRLKVTVAHRPEVPVRALPCHTSCMGCLSCHSSHRSCLLPSRRAWP